VDRHNAGSAAFSKVGGGRSASPTRTIHLTSNTIGLSLPTNLAQSLD